MIILTYVFQAIAVFFGAFAVVVSAMAIYQNELFYAVVAAMISGVNVIVFFVQFDIRDKLRRTRGGW